MRLVHSVFAALATTIAAAPSTELARTSERLAARSVRSLQSTLTFSPVLAVSGARIGVTYHPTGTLSAEHSLILRARFRAAHTEQLVAMRTVVVATLRRASDGTFKGTFVFPDSFVFAAFAVEDSAGQRVDANGGKKWELLTRTPKGQPTYAALMQSANEHYGYWGLALESNRRAMRLYPDSLDGWTTLRFHENLALGQSGPEADSVLAWHRTHFAGLHERYANRTDLPPETIARLFDYASRLNDTLIAAFWRKRLLNEATGTRTAAQQRGVATLMQLYRDKDTAKALAAFEAYWPDAKGKHSQLPGWALQTAAGSGDTVAVDRWVKRIRDDGGSASSIVYQIQSMPARRAEALELQRSVLARMDAVDAIDANTRPLDRTVNDDSKERLKTRAEALGTLGRILASMGQIDAAIDTLDRAAARAVSPDLFRVLADLRLTKGDTAGAARDLAMIAADPALAQPGRDSLRTRLGWTANDARWTAQLDSASARVMPLVVADAVNWAPSRSRVSDDARKPHPLAQLVSGAPTVLVFWATNCGPCVGEIPELVRMTPALEAKGVKVISVSIDDAPSPTMRKFIETKRMNYPVYYDLQHEASNVFGVVGIPAVFVLDAAGHVRYARSELSQVARQLETLR